MNDGGDLGRQLQRTALLGKSTNSSGADSIPDESPLLPIVCDADGVLLARVISGPVGGGVSATNITTSADELTQPNTDPSLLVSGAQLGYNETSYDRWRNNVSFIALPSAARMLTVATPTLINYNHRGGHFIVNVTSFSGPFTLAPRIQAQDTASGDFYDLLVGTAITNTGIVVYKVAPSSTAIPGFTTSDILPRNYRMNMVHVGAATSITYSVSINLVV